MHIAQIAALALPLALITTTALAQTPAATGAPGAASTATAPVAWTGAEVRKIDPSTGKITLKHEDIKNLDMPAMTMVFQVRDKSLFDRVKAGDKVRFVAESDKGAYFVTKLQSAP